MGFVIGRTFELDFEGTDLGGADGAKVTMRSASIGEINAMGEMSLEDECAFIATKIVRWNLETEPGTPLEISAEGVLALEAPMRNLIFGEWMKATKGVTAPLDHRSTDGSRSLEASMPMESLS